MVLNEEKEPIEKDGNDDDNDKGFLHKLNYSFTHGKGIMGSNQDKESSVIRNISPQTAGPIRENKNYQFNAAEIS